MPRQPQCPICGKPAKQEFRPFCSRRCADIDLGRWLNGAYGIPDWREGAGDEREDSEAGEAQPDQPPGKPSAG